MLGLKGTPEDKLLDYIQKDERHSRLPGGLCGRISREHSVMSPFDLLRYSNAMSRWRDPISRSSSRGWPSEVGPAFLFLTPGARQAV